MPEDFEFNLNFDIVSFTFSVVKGGDYFSRTGRGNILTEEMKNIVRNAKRGERVWIEDIKAKRSRMVNANLIQLISFLQ